MSDLKLSVLITAIDKFSAPAQKIAGVSEQLATRLHDGQKALEARLGRAAAEMDKATGRTAALGRELAATTGSLTKGTVVFKASMRPRR